MGSETRVESHAVAYVFLFLSIIVKVSQEYDLCGN
jgi:hypothetical protein